MILSYDSKYQSSELVTVMPCKIGSNDRLHKHNYFEAVYITGGEATHILGNQRIKLERGDFFIIDYETKHMFEVKDGKEIQVVNVIFKPEMVDLSLKGCNTFKELCKNYFIRLNVVYADHGYYFCKDENNVLMNIIDAMLTEFKGEQVGKNELIRSLLVELIIRAARLSKINKQYVQYKPTTLKIINILEQSFFENITLSDISKDTNYSVSFLSKTFKADTGMGFQQYLYDLRIKQSELLLTRTDKKISEISALVGFSDVNRFYKLFRQTHGITPKKYRQTH